MYCVNSSSLPLSSELVIRPVQTNSFVKGGRKYFCPVPECVAKSSNSSGFSDSELKRHWTEKHEEFVLMHHCSQCDFSSKRKGSTFRHFRLVHGSLLPFGTGPQEWKANKEYICPAPYTLRDAFRK
ncbi:hypothetical protein ElyMa_005542700 [Elysia marginata]|uniref:C2H2-type domain-containing protein n=1 Tax=Elysia marginata TaxID=1093978 RepID=A0AAV4EXP4_9GAST|nr:hypothetical protein ElyMa_005542700 [Elysia marginata]